VKPRGTASAIWIAALLAAQAAQGAIWVSPGGSDSSPGSEEEPVRTLEHARDLVRSLNRDMADDITVFLSGEYRLTRPLELGPQDSATNGYSIIYMAAPDARPVLRGSVPIPGWTAVDRGRGLWSAPVPAVLGKPARILVDGIASYPLPNNFDLIGRPGHWHLDAESGRLYYAARAGEDPATADFEAPVAASLLAIGGSAERPVSGLVFKGIRFSGAGTPGSAAVSLEGASSVQFLEDRFTETAGPALSLGPGVSGASAEGCLFALCGGPAVEISSADGVRLTDCRISYCGLSSTRGTAVSAERSRAVVLEHDQIDHFPSEAVRRSDAEVTLSECLVSTPMIPWNGDASPGPVPGSGITGPFADLASEAVAPRTAPDAPVDVAAFGGDHFAYVTWEPPLFDGGRPVTAYVVTASSGESLTVSPAQFLAKGYALVSGLENNAPLTFTVATRTAAGDSPPSLPSAAVTPAWRRRLRAPAPPSRVTVAAGRDAMTVTIAPPGSTGGGTVVAYSVSVGGAPAVMIEGLDVMHADETQPVVRVLRGPPAPVSVAAVNSAGVGKAALVQPGEPAQTPNPGR
jgi:hypothetical protein